MVAGLSVRDGWTVLFYEDEDLKRRFWFLVSGFWFVLGDLTGVRRRCGLGLRRGPLRLILAKSAGFHGWVR